MRVHGEGFSPDANLGGFNMPDMRRSIAREFQRMETDGTRVLSAEISDGYDSSDDSVTRRELGTLVERDGRTVLTQGPVELDGVTVAQ